MSLVVFFTVYPACNTHDGLSFHISICAVDLTWICFFFQAEDGIRDLVRSRGLGDVYKRQDLALTPHRAYHPKIKRWLSKDPIGEAGGDNLYMYCLLYTSDAADERSSVDLGGRRIIKKKKQK